VKVKIRLDASTVEHLRDGGTSLQDTATLRWGNLWRTERSDHYLPPNTKID